MSKLPEWTPEARIMLERIELLALARLEKMILSGKDADARAAAKMILDRSMPEPKIDSSARSLTFVASSNATQTAELMEKMKRRIEAQPQEPEPAAESEESDQEDPAEG